jgi:hypothetical protein
MFFIIANLVLSIITLLLGLVYFILLRKEISRNSRLLSQEIRYERQGLELLLTTKLKNAYLVRAKKNDNQ